MPTTSMLLPQAFTGTWTGSWIRLPERTPGEPSALPTACGPPLPSEWLTQVLSAVSLNSPAPAMLLPQTFTGTWTGTWTLLPEPTPGEPLATPSACAPPPEPSSAADLVDAARDDEVEEESAAADFFSSSVLAHTLPAASLSAPTAPTVLPHTFTGASTGTWTLFPDSTPGEFSAAPSACESARAGAP